MIELMVVMAIVAIAMAVVSLALRDPALDHLERDAARLAALLEMARAEARASGLPASWAPVADSSGAQFRFFGASPRSGLPDRWLDERVRAQVVGAARLVLGPEAILPPQRVVLRLDPHRLEVASDGLASFAVLPAATP
jgi:general secretion pathway protein H